MAIINEKKVEILLKGGFSERKGIKHFSDIVQTESLNERTRNKVYTVTRNVFDRLESYELKYRESFVNYLYEEILSLTKRDIPVYISGRYNFNEVFNNIYNIFSMESYEEIFTFIEGMIKCFEFIDKNMGNYLNLKKDYENKIQKVFKEENVNYKIIDSKITDIVDEEQIKSIGETLNNPYKVVSEHYSKAIEQLYSVKDYANSIKESISSVEAMCQVINGSKEELKKALDNLKIKIHPALEQGYIKLYAFTCDENGSRHANGLSEGEATFEEAKYMLISCSAFVNYLKENFEKGK